MSRSAPATNTAQKKTRWLERIARQRASGKTIAAFCLEENLGKSTFSYWRRRLGVGTVAAAAGRKRTAQAAPFLDLGPIKAMRPAELAEGKGVAHESSAGVELRLELGGGVVLHLTRH